MENKKTTELIDLIGKYSIKERNEEETSDKETENYVEAMEELAKRPPFNLIFNGYPDEEKGTIEGRIDSLEENTENFQKKIKRHKHDKNSGDVLIRI